MRSNIREQLEQLRSENEVPTQPSERQTTNRDSIKKYYIEPDDKTKVLDNTSFVEFVSQTANLTSANALSSIKAGKVTVNREIIVDENFQLNSGDVVRVGVLGHFLVGPDNISIVK